MAIRALSFVVLTCAALIHVGCATNSCVSAKQLKSADAAAAADAQINHVVLIWLKKPGDVQARQALINSGKELKTIPGVVDVRAGVMMPSTRPVVDSTYDVGLIITFTDKAALDNYAGHPTHVKLLNEVLKPNVDHYVVYDFKKP